MIRSDRVLVRRGKLAQQPRKHRGRPEPCSQPARSPGSPRGPGRPSRTLGPNRDSWPLHRSCGIRRPVQGQFWVLVPQARDALLDASTKDSLGSWGQRGSPNPPLPFPPPWVLPTTPQSRASSASNPRVSGKGPGRAIPAGALPESLASALRGAALPIGCLLPGDLPVGATTS